ncbi:MAG: restriction endonuclease subunit S [bacterium]
MADLKRAKIGELCTLEKGSTGLAKASSGKYPLVTTGAERKTSRDYQFDTKAVCIPLVSSTGHGKKTLNYVHYQEGKFALGTILAALIPKDENVLSPRYLHAYLQKNKDRVIVPLMKGAANVSLSVQAISNIEIPLPPVWKQEEIISKIDSVSVEHRDLLNESDIQITLFGKLRQTVLQEAIEGKLTAEWRKQNFELISGDNHASKLLEKIKAEKERLIKDGKIREGNPLSPITDNEKPFTLPNGWVWCKLEDLVSLLGDGLHGTPNYSNNGEYFFINGNNLNEGKVLIKDNTKRVSLEEYNKHKKELTQKTVLVSINGTLGNVALYNNEKIILGKSACYLNLLTGVSKYYMMQIIKTKYFLIYASDNASETTIKNLSLKGMRMFLVPLPSIAEQEAIVERVDKLMAMINELEKQVTERKNQSEMLMHSVLREAFAG